MCSSDLIVYGLPTSTSVTFGGNAEFVGILYAPSAELRFNGGGADRADFMGAAIVGGAQLNGHFEFHYDENLGRIGPTSSFVIDLSRGIGTSKMRSSSPSTDCLWSLMVS